MYPQFYILDQSFQTHTPCTWYKRLALHVNGVIRFHYLFFCMALTRHLKLSWNKSNLILLVHMINDVNMIVSIELYLMRRVPFNYPLLILISTTTLFYPQIVLVGFNCIQFKYVAVRGALKGFIQTRLVFVTIILWIPLICCKKRFKESCTLVCWQVGVLSLCKY